MEKPVKQKFIAPNGVVVVLRMRYRCYKDVYYFDPSGKGRKKSAEKDAKEGMTRFVPKSGEALTQEDEIIKLIPVCRL